MAMDLKTAKSIQDFVYAQPRTIQDVALMLGKNWRTAESYVEQVAKDYGTISVKTFRAGTKGALKIVFWAHIEKIHANSMQETLLSQIKRGRQKGDFEPFDIYYYANDKNFYVKPSNQEEDQQLIELLQSAKSVILNFSGNLSWTKRRFSNKTFTQILPELVRKGVAIKLLTRIDIASVHNMREIEKINKEAGYDAIEIRHAFQPLRGFIIDGKIANLKDERKSIQYKKGELRADMDIYFNIMDPIWVSWLEKVFWHLFSQAMPAKERLEELKKIDEAILNSAKN